MEKQYTDKVEIGRVKAYINYDWHRGMIALPCGKIELDDYGLEKELRFRKGETTDIAWDAWDRTLHGMAWENGGLSFNSSYVEFLHPGSEGYEFHIHIQYPCENMLGWADFRDDYELGYSMKSIKRAYEKYKALCGFYDKVISKLEPEVRSLAKKAETYSFEEDLALE